MSRSGDQRFNHALIGLDEETIGVVTDVLEECSYVRLKEQLIRRLSISEEAKPNHLLNEVTLGNRNPSQLLQEMKHYRLSNLLKIASTFTPKAYCCEENSLKT